MPGGAAAAERVQHDIVFVGRCFDNSLQQRERFLSGVVKSFVADGLPQRINVGPPVRHRSPFGLVQITSSAGIGFITATVFIGGSELGDRRFRYRRIRAVENAGVAFAVTENNVVLAVESVFRSLAAGRITPNDFIAVVFLAENFIHHHFQVMRCGRVAVQVNAAGVFQHAVHLRESLGHI